MILQRDDIETYHLKYFRIFYSFFQPFPFDICLCDNNRPGNSCIFADIRIT